MKFDNKADTIVRSVIAFILVITPAISYLLRGELDPYSFSTISLVAGYYFGSRNGRNGQHGATTSDATPPPLSD